MVTRFIDGARTMSPESFQDDARARRRGPARRSASCTTSGAVFPFRFELFAMIDDYLKILATKDVDLPAGYHDVVREAEAVRAALDAHPVPLAACHCDPLCENFLDTGERMWIVDWEYSGMNDPMWDLGDLAVEGGFDEAQEDEMLACLFRSGADAGRAWPHRHLQGDVRSVVDPVGAHPARQQQSGRRFPRLCRQPLRALPRIDADGGFLAPC